MGSYDRAVMTGFICRLCSELNSNVVHIYSEKGIKLQLAEKINLMPISVEPQDNLPKTICFSCVHQLDNQYRLIQQLRNSRDKILAHARMRVRLHEERERHSQNGTTSQSSSESSESGSEHRENRIQINENNVDSSQNNEQINIERSSNCVQEQGARSSEMDISDGNNNSSP